MLYAAKNLEVGTMTFTLKEEEIDLSAKCANASLTQDI